MIKQTNSLSNNLVISVVLIDVTFFFYLQACKGEDLGKVEFDEEIKKRFKMVYVPNWFSVDLKTGVSDKPGYKRSFHLSSSCISSLSLVYSLTFVCCVFGAE